MSLSLSTMMSSLKEQSFWEELSRTDLKEPLEKWLMNCMSKQEDRGKRSQSKLPLPFCGSVIAECCQAVVLNNQLFTQCEKKKTKTFKISGEVEAEYSLCDGCYKSVVKKAQNGVDAGKLLTYGTIEQRIANGGVFAANGSLRKPVSYSVVMAKLGITQEEAEAEAERRGVTLPVEELKEKPTRRGRPKKTKSIEIVADTSSEDEGQTKRKRTSKVLTGSSDGENLIAALVAEAQVKAGSDDDFSEMMKKPTHEEKVQQSVDEIVKKQAAVMAGLPKESWKPITHKMFAPKGEENSVKKSTAATKKSEKALAAAAKKAEKAAAAEAKKAEKAAAAQAKKAEKAAAAQAKKEAAEAKKAEKEAAKKTKPKKADAKPKKADSKPKKEAAKPKKADAKPKKEKTLSAKAYLEKHGQDSVGAIENGKQLCVRKSGVAYWKPVEAVDEPEVAVPVVVEELGEEKIVVDSPSSVMEAEVEDNVASEEAEDEEEVQVTKWTCPADDKEYLLAADNVVYDASTHEPVGVWNEKEGKIDELADEEE